jgi:hypothetical protein
LEYIRSTGIDLKKLEKDQEEEARYMKSYLEQKRPTLISRPKQAPNILSIPPGLGGVQVPPAGGILPVPGGVSVAPNPSQLQIKNEDDGSGLGWSLWSHAVALYPVYKDVLFVFTPTHDASYTFTASLTFHGFYILQADDGVFTSKSADVEVWVTLNAHQFVDRPWKWFPAVINRYSQNINEFDNFDQTFYFADTQDFHAGEPVGITVRIELVAVASRDGSHAEVNFQDGDNSYIQPGLWVSPVP